MGGATRPLAKLCPPPHPTPPRGRKGTPRLPDLPRFSDPGLCGVVGDLECLLVMAAAVAMETGE